MHWISLSVYCNSNATFVDVTNPAQNGSWQKKSYCTLSGKNGNSIFVLFSLYIFILGSVWCHINYIIEKDIPRTCCVRSGWWHKNHYYMTTAFESLILINVHIQRHNTQCVFFFLHSKWVQQPHGIPSFGYRNCIWSTNREQALQRRQQEWK